MYEQILPLRQIDDSLHLQIGGKAENLAKLMVAGMPVPDAWVIPAEVFREHLERYGIDGTARSVAEHPGEEGCRQVQQAILHLDVDEKLCEAFSVHSSEELFFFAQNSS